MTRFDRKAVMLKMSVAISNAWIRTIMDISRKPNIHTLIVIAIPPYISWTCDDSRNVCELYLYNLVEELENLGLLGIVQTQGNKYHVEVYETIKL